jgi:hypothetical protein
VPNRKPHGQGLNSGEAHVPDCVDSSARRDISIGTRIILLSVSGCCSALSAFGLVLLVPQGVVEIEDTRTEGGAARVDTHIGAGQTHLRPIALMGAQGTTRTEQCGKGAS